MNTLSVNQILFDVDSEKKFRILWIDENYILSYVIDIEDRLATPYIIRISELNEKIHHGEMVLRLEEMDIFIDRKPTQIDIEYRDKSWQIIKDIVKLEPDIYEKSKRKKLIDSEVILKKKVNSHNTVYKLLRKYWQRGKVKDSLYPNYYNSGHGGSPVTYKKKPGRSKNNGKGGIIIGEKEKNIFAKVVNKYYLTKEKQSLSHAYKMMIKEYYHQSTYYKDGNKQYIIEPVERKPTLRQFSYWFKKEYTGDSVIKAREGEHIYEKDYRQVLGSSAYDTFGPGSVYQVDATIANVYIISRLNRNWSIGRPVVYFVVDVFSRLITGMYIGIENVSWKAMSSALANAHMDKVEYCKKYGINITLDQWPACHSPTAIVGDRGELISKFADKLTNGLGIEIENLPPYRPDWKGIVEKLFDTSQEKIKPFLPGYVHSNYGERGSSDYRLDAAITIDEYTKILIYFVNYYNQNFYIKDYVRDSDMIEDEVEPIPIKLWEWGVRRKSGKLRSPKMKMVNFYLLPTGEATVTDKGIKYKRMLYNCETAMKQSWYSKARQRGTWKVSISFDPRNMDIVYLHTNDKELYEECNLLEHQEVYQGKTLEEIEQLIEHETNEYIDFQDVQLENEINLFSNIESIVEKALEDKKETFDATISKTKRVSNIKQYRNEELEERRKEESLVQPFPYTSEDEDKISKSEQPVKNENRVSILDLYKKKRQRNLDDE
ncbi:DDE-type integrase/transposase/recombinase [Bacillus sp. 31A1R]|uniref:DDE-type integrase/transposase/recombinase n=1 Tax=Robertmurraya mangrovi TaxID=3098077 RepID=A0ABU5J444_9BACI|nr:Mu transposase C-terminal domain-containing protein [Bacillus sp. 31A1R]MDZ5474184.1 DDE-type integrase/transposase/recombinase [Bacillus sp. 31A1R]